MLTERSRGLFARAQEVLPGGVDSPVRAFRAVGGHPLFIERGQGAYVWDADGNRYIDYVGSWGPLIAGHAHPDVVSALQRAAERGTSYGMPSRLEVELAEAIIQAVPSVEMVRFVNSGTEATMSALRLARAYTGRTKIIKFEGCYHGHADALLVQAGSGVATLGLPDSPGVPPGATQDTLVATYNDLTSVAALFDRYGPQIAAVIIEPVAGNMGVVPPMPGFLEGLRELAVRHAALLIFDEVMTGFRVAYGGAQTLYGISPDLTCFGKVIGGGLPVGAYGGRRDIMRMVAPAGPMYQAGTLSGNPLAMTAGIETLKLLRTSGAYEELERKSAALAAGVAGAAKSAGVPIYQTRVGSMFCAFFTSTGVRDWPTAKQADTSRFARFFQTLLDCGVYLAPSQFEAGFMSLAHSDADVAQTIGAVDTAMQALEA
jgi:glutamate-1-semialdehyde 2,1-aminomutase